MLSNHFILCHHLLPLALVLPSIRVFSSESALHIRWPNYWSFSFSNSSSNEYSSLISFWIDWFDLLEVQRTLKSLLHHHSSKASILQHSGFFIVQLSHAYMITKITYILTFSPTSFEHFLRAIWNAISQAVGPILLQIKLNSQLFCCAFFQGWQCSCCSLHSPDTQVSTAVFIPLHW